MSRAQTKPSINALMEQLANVEEEKNNLLNALELSPMALCHQDLQLRYTWLRNPHLGFSVESSLGKTDWDLLDKDIADKMGEIKRRVIRTGVGERVDIPTKPGDKNSKYFELTVEPRYDRTSGEMIGISCAGMNVTDDRRRREAYRTSEENLRFIFNASPMPIVVLDQKSESAVFYNQAADNMFKLSSKHDKPISLLNRLGIQHDVQQSMTAGYDLNDHLFSMTKDDTEIFVCVSARSIFFNGQPTILTLFHDLTTQLRVEKQLREMNIELERRVYERTEELVKMNTALSDAKKMAEASSEAKSEFLARMSHEIRTPINGILGMLQIVENATHTPEQLECIKTAMASGEALLVLVNDLLDFSKIESGTVSIKQSIFDVRALIHSLVKLFEPQAASKRLTMSVLIAPDIPEMISGDKGRLGQILINLLNNAIKFTESGGVSLEVTPIKEGTQVSLQFAITDTGIGIPEDVQHRIFEAFYQVNESITRKHGGTGLGLRICQQLVELMNGKIGFHSVQGRGTTVWFTTPISETVSPLADQTENNCVVKGMRVLIVGNESDYCDSVSEQFERLGSLQHVVADTYVASTLLSSAQKQGKPYSLVILIYPLVNNDACAAELITNIVSVQTRVMVLAKHHVASDAATKGMMTLPDTVDTETLLSAINQLFKQPPVQPQPEHQSPATSKQLLAARKLNVLVVEDNDINQRVIEKMVVRLGHQVTLADDGIAALRALDDDTFNLVLMDCHMPHLDGYSTTRYIREHEQEHVIIIAVTANVNCNAAQQCYDAGMDDYMSKPVRMTELAKKIDQWLDSKYRGENPATLFDNDSNRLT